MIVAQEIPLRDKPTTVIGYLINGNQDMVTEKAQNTLMMGVF